MRQGIAAYRKKNFEGARSAFANAWEIERHADIAAALAEVEMQLGRYREAAEHWEYNLAHGGDVNEASAQLAECRKHIARVRIEVDPPSAEVLVDGVAVPRAAYEKGIWLDPGDHRLVAREGSRSSPELKLYVSAAEERSSRLSVPPPAPVPPPAVQSVAPPSPPVQPASHDGGGLETRTVVVIGGAVLTAAAVGLGVYGELKAQAADTRRVQLLGEAQASLPDPVPGNQVCYQRPGGPDIPKQCSEISSKVDEAIEFQRLRNASFIAGGVLGVATVTTFLLWPKARKEAERTGISVAPLDVAGSRGVQLRLRF
jgi:hypothetical protein